MTRSITPKSSGRREAAHARAARRAAQRRLWRGVRRAAAALGIAAIAVVIVLAYRQAGGGGGGPSPEGLVNRQAPDFTLPTVDGKQVTLSDFEGNKNVLLFFNEGYGCAPCWAQTYALQQDLEKFAALDTEVFAVMVDPPDLLAREAPRWNITLPILVDQSTRVSQSYDALGGMHANKPDHMFVLVDKEGVVRWARDYPSMWVENEVVVEQVRGMVQP